MSESDLDDEPDLPPLRSPLPAGVRNYMTPGGAQRLQDEIDLVTRKQRPRLVDAVADARGSGREADRRALKAAQAELAALDRRLAYLGELKRTCEVISAKSGPAERVTFGATVVVRDRERSTEETYRIVGVYESDPENGLISFISPIAKALLGRSPGETVEVSLPDGVRLLKIISAAHSPER